MEQNMKIIDYFYTNPQVLSKISQAEVMDVVTLGTAILADDTSSYLIQKKAFGVLCQVASIQRLPLQDRWTLYQLLNQYMFISTTFDSYTNVMEAVYESIYFDLEKQISPALLHAAMPAPSKKQPVVIITSQFLAPEHAPTRRVLDYSYTIQTRLNTPVIIINEAGLHLKEVPYMHAFPSFAYGSPLTSVKNYTYKDTAFQFYQTPCTMPNLTEISNILYTIRQSNPMLVLNVGANCLTSDLCHNFVKTATIACSTSMPRSLANYLVLCRELRSSDQKRLSSLYPWQTVVESVFNYIMPDDSQLNTYHRADFNIPEDACLLVCAGNRLQVELDDEFLTMINTLINTHPEFHFLLIGDIADQDAITAHFDRCENLHLAGPLKDGSQAIRLGDIYVQPTRKGGGRAAFEALYYGLPVITTKYGDTWDVCGDTFAVSSYSEMQERIIYYHESPDTYRTAQHLGIEHAHKLEDMVATFQALFDHMGLPYSTDSDHTIIPILGYKNLFPTESERKLSEISNSLKQLNHSIYVAERRMRDLEWATVFNATIVGSTWFKDISLSPGRCAIGYPALYALYRCLNDFQPHSILEIGLGQSTKMIGAYASHFNTTHYIVESNASWMEFFLKENPLSSNTSMIHLECIETPYSGRWLKTKTAIKYYEGFQERLKDQKFDFIFIDGPNGSEEFSRVDFTELLPECLQDSFVIMVDDAERNGEQNTIQAISIILEKYHIAHTIAIMDGLKNTALIVSEDLAYLTSI